MRGQEEEEEREIRGTGYEFRKLFCSLHHAFCDIKKNTKLLVVAFLYDGDSKVSHPLVGSLVRSGSRFIMTFLIGVKSYMRVTNVTLDY